MVVLVGSWVMGLNYARLTPFGPGHERANAVELGHLGIVRGLIAGKGLPQPAPEAGLQSNQPPLYYILTTAYAKVTGLRDPAHNADLDIKLRSVGVIFGVLTVFGIYRIGFQLTGDQTMGVLAAASVGLTPMFCSTAATISNDMGGACFCTLALASLAKLEKESRALRFAGLWTALALGTHPMAIALVVPWAIMLLWPKKDRRFEFVGLAIAVVLSFPFILILAKLGGPSFGYISESTFDFGGFVQQSLKSWVGIFGSGSVYLSNSIYVPFLIITLGIALVGPFAIKTAMVRRTVAVCCFLIAALVVYVLLNFKNFDPSASHLLSAGGGFGLLTAYGWRRIISNDLIFQIAVVALVLALFGLNAYVFHLLPSHLAAIAARSAYLS